MKGVASGFLIGGVVSAVLGMIWGIQMAATHDHGLSPAHGHLNLVGWVSLMLFGFYYHAVPAAAQSGLAKVHLIVALAGVVIMVPGIAIALQNGPEIFAILGSMLTLGSMLLFAVNVIRFRDASERKGQPLAAPSR